MLSYRTGAAGSRDSALSAARYYTEPSLNRDSADLAAYYARETTPTLSRDADIDAAARAVARGDMTMDDALDALVKTAIDPATLLREAARLPDELSRLAAALGIAVLSGSVSYRDACDMLGDHELRAGADINGVIPTTATVALLDNWISRADPDVAIIPIRAELAEATRQARDIEAGGRPTVGTWRGDTDANLAALLGVDPRRSPSDRELAWLLYGARADGQPIAGKQVQQRMVSVADLLRLNPTRLPTQGELQHLLNGRLADGTAAKYVERAAFRPLWKAFRVRHPEGGPTPDEATHLLAGRGADGRKLHPRKWARQVQATKTAIAFMDCSFSAPKSVSLAWAFAPTEAERAIIVQAHRDATETAMRHLVSVLGNVTRGKAGRGGREQGATTWVRFDHYSARPTVPLVRRDRETGLAYTQLVELVGDGSSRVPGDPQVHSHALLFNVVRTESGRVGAMDRNLLLGRVEEFGMLYQAALATNLRAHGVDAYLDETTGFARLRSVPASVEPHFSKRSRDSEAAAREWAKREGLVWDDMATSAKLALLRGSVLSTRLEKNDSPTEWDSWRAQARALSWKHESVLGQITPQARTREDRLEHAYAVACRMLDVDWQRRAVITGAEMRVAACRGLIAAGMESADDIGELTKMMRERGVRHDGHHVALIWATSRDRTGREYINVTTERHVERENGIVAMARAAAADLSAALPLSAIEAAVMRRPDLDFSSTDHGRSQRKAMNRLGTGGRLGVFVGVAGAGKSTLMAPLVDAWRAAGRTVYGASLAWLQADALVHMGIEPDRAAALAAFLWRADAGVYKLDRNAVVVLDELGMVGTKQLHHLLRLQKEHGFQVVALGDDKQCQSIEAGGVLTLLRQALGSAAIPDIVTTVRQKAQREQMIAGLFREGDAATALAMKLDDGTAEIVAGDRAATIRRTVEVWQQRRDANRDTPRYTVAISAPTNADARDIGAALRLHRRRLGEVGPDVAVLPAIDRNGAQYELPIAVGDHVRLFERVGRLRNGSISTVVAVTQDGLTLRLLGAGDRTSRVTWGALRDHRTGRILLSYGDCHTIDASQGSTVTDEIVSMPSGSSMVQLFKAYVAHSRHTQSAYLICSDAAERAQITLRRAIGDMRAISRQDVIDTIARNLSHEPEKQTALQFLEGARAVRRSTPHRLQSGSREIERGATVLTRGLIRRLAREVGLSRDLGRGL